MKNINNRFDTNKPFIEGMLDETDKLNLHDSVFEQACEEYDISEEDAMELMINSNDYKFVRLQESWAIINLNEED